MAEPRGWRLVWNDPVWSKVIAAAIVALAAGAWAGRNWVWQDITLSRSQVFAWCMLAFAIGALVAFSIVRRASRSAPARPAELPTDHATKVDRPKEAPEVAKVEIAFKPILAIDERHELEWHVLDDLDDWLAKPARSTDATIVDGPFHSDPNCRERLGTKFIGTSNYLAIDPKCPRCHRLLFTGDLPTQIQGKRDVVEEVRRMSRMSLPITARIALAHVGYWNKMKPARASAS